MADIEHNHSYDFGMRKNLVSDNCPKCLLDHNAESLLLAAEKVLTRLSELSDYQVIRDMKAIIDQIRKGAK